MKITIEPTEGEKLELFYGGGIALPWAFAEVVASAKNYDAHVDEVKNLSIRDDDLYLATYPKCGTHWSWEIMAMLQRGNVEYEKSTKGSLFLDFKTVEEIGERPSPRILNCHFPAQIIPKQLVEKKIKIVNMMRNPKDTFVSFYHHMKAELKDEDFVKDFKTFLPYIMGTYGISLYCSFFDYMKSWEDFTEEHPEQILNLYFEDMKEDPVREVKKIDKFLGTNRDDELIKQIAEACDFKTLKKADEELKNKPGYMPDGGSYIYRKGDVGDWKNHFTVSMNEEFDEWLKQQSKGTKLNFSF